jgi:hypothetical protein
MRPNPALALLLLALPSDGQDSVLVVDAALGPGADFAKLEDALAAAGRDDLVLVRSGFYGMPLTSDDFEIERAVRVVAEEGASVALGSPIHVSGLGQDETVLLRGLELDFTSSSPITHAMALQVFQCAGLVWVEGCRLVGPVAVFPEITFLPPQTVRVDEGRLVLCSCSIVGGGLIASYTEMAALWMRSAEVTLYDSVVRCHGDPPDINGFPAISAQGSLLFVSGSSVHGPSGSDAAPPGLGPGCAESGGPGILLAAGGAGSELYLLASDVAGGPPGTPGTLSCPPALPGPALEVEQGTATRLAGGARSLASPATVAAGDTVQVGLQGGVPGQPAVLALSTGAAGTFEPALAGVLLLSPPFGLAGAGVTDPAGALTFAFAAPPPLAGTEALQLYLQAICAGTPGRAVSSGTALSILAPGL